MVDLQLTAFVINLRRRPDRKRRMNAVLPVCLRSESKTCWMEAMDGRSLDQRDLRGFGLFPSWEIESSNPWWSRPLKGGEVGCAISHWRCWNEARRRGEAPVLVLEDDVSFAANFCSRVSMALERLFEMDSSWGMCYLGRFPMEPDISLEDGLVRPGYSHCTFAYVLSAVGLDAVLESGYEQGLIPIDEFLPAMYCDHPRRDVRSKYPSRMTAYALEPTAVRQLPKDVAGSDTEDSVYVVH